MANGIFDNHPSRLTLDGRSIPYFGDDHRLRGVTPMETPETIETIEIKTSDTPLADAIRDALVDYKTKILAEIESSRGVKMSGKTDDALTKWAEGRRHGLGVALEAIKAVDMAASVKAGVKAASQLDLPTTDVETALRDGARYLSFLTEYGPIANGPSNGPEYLRAIGRRMTEA